MVIRPARKDDVDAIQNIFNSRECIASLGGFHMRDQVASKVAYKGTAVACWVCEYDGKLVGAMEMGRPQSHLCKLGEVGVLEPYRRQRIGTSLYLTCIAQSVIEGRRLFEDTIVGDNPVQHKLLPTIGLYVAGTLRKKTASGKDIVLYQLDLIDSDLSVPFGRMPSDLNCYIMSGPYQQDVWGKNMDILKKRDDSGWLRIMCQRRGEVLAKRNFGLIVAEVSAVVTKVGGFFPKRERLKDESASS